MPFSGKRLSGGYHTDILTDGEIERDINRKIEQVADAMKYGGPAYAEMYRKDLRILMREQDARRSGARRMDPRLDKYLPHD